jgi:hypothetical protein
MCRLPTSNLAIAILGFVVFFARTAMSHLRYLPRYANIIYDMILFGLWAVSITGQISGDFSDPEHPSPHPWYLTRRCSVAWDRTEGYCRTAQAGFALSVMAMALYGTRLIREVVLTAYERGQRHQPKWSVQDDGVEPMENIYTDEEWDSASGSKVAEDIQGLALSPVLAFFPSDTDNRW